MRVNYMDLRTGDTVRLNHTGAWNVAVVKNLSADEITFYRPYVVQARFIDTAGVGLSIGIEVFSDWRSRHTTVELLGRNGDLR